MNDPANPSTEVRFITSKDLRTLESFLNIYSKAPELFFFNWELKDILNDAPEDGQDYWVGIFRDSTLCGICSIGQDEEFDWRAAKLTPIKGRLYLSDVYVLPEFRHQNLGSDLVRGALALASESHPSHEIRLSVLEDSLVPFYENLGFTLIDPDCGEMSYLMPELPSAPDGREL